MAMSFAGTVEDVGTLTRVENGDYGGTPMSDGYMAYAPHSLTNAPAISIIAIASEQTEGNSHIPIATPSGFTEIGNAQSSLDESTDWSRTAIWVGWREEPDTEIERLDAQFENGAGVAMYLGSFTGSTSEGSEEPSEPAVGFRSVAQMIATPGATWAHRGGSTSWPEMSEMAYYNSAALGYGALEFSAARSSDGVWFGLHDRDLNRTSGTTELPYASEMTWAEIQAYTNITQGGDEPYYRMDEFLSTYGHTHVVIIDPKYAMPHLDELFTILSQQADRKRVIVKCFGPHSGAESISTRVAQYGFSSWGYYYPEQVADGTLATTQHHWAILGMDYGADQSDWDAILAYGKPVCGHIATSVNAYNMAITKGARMVQCAAVSSIPAVGAPITTQPWDAVYVDGSRIPSDVIYLGSTKVYPRT